MKKKKSLKNFFVLLALWLVTIIAVFASSVLYDRYKASEYEDFAVPYIEKIIPEISKWDPVVTRALMAPEVSAAIPEENFIEATSWFSRLGALQSMDKPEFEDVHSGTQASLGEQTIVEYNVDARYENGDATINLKLLERNGAFEIYRFNFGSEILLEK